MNVKDLTLAHVKSHLQVGLTLFNQHNFELMNKLHASLCTSLLFCSMILVSSTWGLESILFKRQKGCKLPPLHTSIHHTPQYSPLVRPSRTHIHNPNRWSWTFRKEERSNRESAWLDVDWYANSLYKMDVKITYVTWNVHFVRVIHISVKSSQTDILHMFFFSR